MFWHPSRARSRRTVLHTAVVRAISGTSMLVRLDSGDERLLPLPDASAPTLVGSTIVVRGDLEWVVAAERPVPDEAVDLLEPVASGDRRLRAVAPAR